jgi:glutaredoxin
MKDLNVIVYTMQGCPFCVDFKEMLTKEGIEFFDRDIDTYSDEYDTFVQIT